MIQESGAREESQEEAFRLARSIYDTGKVHAVSITDNPNGRPSLLGDAVALELIESGITPLLHFSCKDRNRNQIQSQLYALERMGIENLLLMSGDYQTDGFKGMARPVHDLDSLQALALATEMNKGLPRQEPHVGNEKPCHFLKGAVVSPYKYTEGELIPQYLKLEKKILAGADYVVAQIGYDARKMQELISYVRSCGHETPLIANVFLVNKPVAELMRDGVIVGCHIDALFMTALREEEKSPDKGRAACNERAAKMIAVARGLGYAGVHIGGFGLTAETINLVLQRAEELLPRWRELVLELNYGPPEGYYLYEPERDEKGKETGLNSLKLSPRNEKLSDKRAFKNYRRSRFFHRHFLTKDKGFYPRLKRSMDKRERKRGLTRKHGFERICKTMLYGCIDCGDCGLDATSYSCPMTQCPKCQRNGPCGGSMNGWCEVYPKERYCIYYMAYHRLKRYNELDERNSYLTPPNNWKYNETSAWSNYTHERDNMAHRESVVIGWGLVKTRKPLDSSGLKAAETKGTSSQQSPEPKHAAKVTDTPPQQSSTPKHASVDAEATPQQSPEPKPRSEVTDTPPQQSSTPGPRTFEVISAPSQVSPEPVLAPPENKDAPDQQSHEPKQEREPSTEGLAFEPVKTHATFASLKADTAIPEPPAPEQTNEEPAKQGEHMSRSTELSCEEFVEALASKAPTPGGGGAAAMVGALGVALGNMVGSLTVGKPLQTAAKTEVVKLKKDADALQERLIELVTKDAIVFEPLSRAYGLPTNTEEEKAYKSEIMEECLRECCEVPLEIMKACCRGIDLHERFAEVGTAIAISDVGCGVICCKAALQAASLNVFINTKSMKDAVYARRANIQARAMLDAYTEKADEIFAEVEKKVS